MEIVCRARVPRLKFVQISMFEADFLFVEYDCDAVVSRAGESQRNPGRIDARRRYVERGRDSVWRAE